MGHNNPICVGRVLVKKHEKSRSVASMMLQIMLEFCSVSEITFVFLWKSNSQFIHHNRVSDMHAMSSI